MIECMNMNTKANINEYYRHAYNAKACEQSNNYKGAELFWINALTKAWGCNIEWCENRIEFCRHLSQLPGITPEYLREKRQ